MKKNTGCDSHNGCPSQPSCDQANVLHVDCASDSFPPIPCPQTNTTVADIPVVLAEAEVLAEVEADIHLPLAAREIKHMRRNVSLTQCKAIPSKMDQDKVKLYISGVVHKNIQYIEDCSGFMRDYSVDVPFTCSQTVIVYHQPNHEWLSRKNAVYERRFTDKKGLGADQCTSGGFTYEFYNEPIDCKLLFSFVDDIDLYKDFDAWGRFSRITEKMEVGLYFKLIQKQQIEVGGGGGGIQPPRNPASALDEESSPDLEENSEKQQGMRDKISNLLRRIDN